MQRCGHQHILTKPTCKDVVVVVAQAEGGDGHDLLRCIGNRGGAQLKALPQIRGSCYSVHRVPCCAAACHTTPPLCTSKQAPVGLRRSGRWPAP